jgi:hypothetical protein
MSSKENIKIYNLLWTILVFFIFFIFFIIVVNSYISDVKKETKQIIDNSILIVNEEKEEIKNKIENINIIKNDAGLVIFYYIIIILLPIMLIILLNKDLLCKKKC